MKVTIKRIHAMTLSFAKSVGKPLYPPEQEVNIETIVRIVCPVSTWIICRVIERQTAAE